MARQLREAIGFSGQAAVLETNQELEWFPAQLWPSAVVPVGEGFVGAKEVAVLFGCMQL